jgi:hypothetical protein
MSGPPTTTVRPEVEVAPAAQPFCSSFFVTRIQMRSVSSRHAARHFFRRITMNASRLMAVALTFGGLLAGTAAFAAEPARCGSADQLQIRGDVPAAVSFDVFQQLRSMQPSNAQRIALFQSAGEVKRLPDGLTVCEVADDGVDDPSAVLVQLPQGKNTWWVSAANVQEAD